MKKLLLIPLLLSALPAFAQTTCSPFASIGMVQFLDNSGAPAVNAVLYSFQAGTSQQQATFSDSGCSVPNVNPITLTTGARANIWLLTGSVYRFQLCSQNDGAFCAAGDLLASVDQVPGGPPGGGGGGGAPFISTSANPATTGVLRCASGDACLAFRNAANSANFSLTKDANDVLSWAGGSLKFPAVAQPAGLAAGFSHLWNDSTANRWKMANNGGSAVQVVGSGVDINNSDQVTQIHFGATATPLSGTAPTTNQALVWNGTAIVGGGDYTMTSGLFFGGGTCSAGNLCAVYIFPTAHTLTRVVVNTSIAPAGCSTNPAFGVRDLTSNTVLASVTPTATGILDSGALSVAIPATDQIGVGSATVGTGCGTNSQAQVTATYR